MKTTTTLNWPHGAALVLALLLTATSLATAAPIPNAGTTVRVLPETATLKAGESFTVDIAIDTDVASRGAQLNVQFDPALLRCDSVTEGDFYRSWAQAHGGSTFQFPAPVIDNSAGAVSDTSIAILGGSAGGPTGDGAILTLQFTALAAGRPAITLPAVLVSDANVNNPQALAATVVNGSVVVISPVVWLPYAVK